MRKNVFIYCPFVIVFCSVTYFSLTNSLVIPLDSFRLADKLAHLIAFFVLGYTIFRIFLYRSSISMLTNIWILFFLTIYGLGNEVYQSYIPSRTFDWYDALANFTGSFIAVFWGKYLFRFDEMLRNKLILFQSDNENENTLKD